MKLMLGAKLTGAQIGGLRYPVIAQPKIDGVRCYIDPFEGPITRTDKYIPNNFIREMLHRYEFFGLDGELVLPGRTFQDTISVVRSADHKEQYTFMFVVFDHVLESTQHKPYINRLLSISDILHMYGTENMNAIESRQMKDASSLRHYYKEQLAKGEEGIMIRDPQGMYKQGRSTVREGGLLKLKPMKRCVARVIDLVENTNKSLGMGALLVSSPEFGEFKIGTGFTLTQRREMWQSPDSIIGASILFQYQEKGTKDRPRIPVFLEVIR